MNQYHTIIFDLGGVLIDWNPRYVFDKVFEDTREVDYFLENVCHGAWNAEQDRGRSFADAIAIQQKAFPQYKEQIPLYYERWPEMIGGEISGTVELLTKLYHSRQYRLYALTNWSDETFPYAWENFDFLRLFEGILVSGKEKLIKPDPAIYQLLIKRYDIDPGSSIFIDDSLKNVKAAKNELLEAIHYQNPNQLIQSLQKRGIVV
ncbi:HAD family hydrolase [Portibacter marinus]|uniref:HAD family hydrolase n=1 Tax=Portibacter marinus TaxID=2898660 RepID=UPI001F44FABF|nr:HAD family phosphatase [Portibacter marinus]